MQTTVIGGLPVAVNHTQCNEPNPHDVLEINGSRFVIFRNLIMNLPIIEKVTIASKDTLIFLGHVRSFLDIDIVAKNIIIFGSIKSDMGKIEISGTKKVIMLGESKHWWLFAPKGIHVSSEDLNTQTDTLYSPYGFPLQESKSEVLFPNDDTKFVRELKEKIDFCFEKNDSTMMISTLISIADYIRKRSRIWYDKEESKEESIRKAFEFFDIPTEVPK